MNSWLLPGSSRITWPVLLASGCLAFFATVGVAATPKGGVEIFREHHTTLPAGKVPVTMAIKARPTYVHPGAKFEVAVQVKIAAWHHLYATTEAGSALRPATCELTLPAGITAVGEWRTTKPVRAAHGRLIYVNTVEFHRVLQLSTRVSGQPLGIAVTLHYQACTEEICWPPSSLEKTISVTPSIARRRSDG